MAHPEYNRQSLTAASLSGLGMVFSTGPVVLATFALFMLPMAKEFGWGRADISLGLTISSGCAAIADPIIGRMIDRLGVRRVLLPGMMIFALANAALAFVTEHLAMLYLIFAVVGTSSVTCAAVPYSKVASAWFQEKRGLVLGLFLGLGAGAGSALISQIARVLIAELGWRDARLALSGLILAIPLPLMYFFLREPSHPPAGAASAAPRPVQTGLSSAEARRTRAFWMMFAMVFVGTVALAGTVIHMVAMLTDQGLSTAGATTVYSFYAMASIAGRVLIGWAQDKSESPKIGLSVYAAALAGLLMLRYGTTLPVLIPGAMLVGLGFGAQVSLAAYWVSRYWGLRCYGENYGYIYSAASAGAALGPLVMGAIFDLSGSYTLALSIFQGAMIFCGVMVCLMGDYVFSTRRSKPEPAEIQQPSEAAA